MTDERRFEDKRQAWFERQFARSRRCLCGHRRDSHAWASLRGPACGIWRCSCDEFVDVESADVEPADAHRWDAYVHPADVPSGE